LKKTRTIGLAYAAGAVIAVASLTGCGSEGDGTTADAEAARLAPHGRSLRETPGAKRPIGSGEDAAQQAPADSLVRS
jgi:hypothetical protein